MDIQARIQREAEKLLPVIERAVLSAPTPGLRAQALKQILSSVDSRLSTQVADSLVRFEAQGLSPTEAMRLAIQTEVAQLMADRVADSGLGLGDLGLNAVPAAQSPKAAPPAAPRAPAAAPRAPATTPRAPARTASTSADRRQNIATIVGGVTEGLTATAQMVGQIYQARAQAQQAAALPVGPPLPMGPGLDPYGMPLPSTTPWGLILGGAAAVVVIGGLLYYASQQKKPAA